MIARIPRRRAVALAHVLTRVFAVLVILDAPFGIGIAPVVFGSMTGHPTFLQRRELSLGGRKTGHCSLSTCVPLLSSILLLLLLLHANTKRVLLVLLVLLMAMLACVGFRDIGRGRGGLQTTDEFGRLKGGVDELSDTGRKLSHEVAVFPSCGRVRFLERRRRRRQR